MVDITSKSNSLRIAIAEAFVTVSKKESILAIKNGTVPKGNVFEMAKTAGLFAVKRTSDMIPDCHPLPVEFAAVRFEMQGKKIRIEMEVRTVYKTGVEVEAMHGASVVALTIYDMLKPIDKGIEIVSIRLKEKKGGKSDVLGKFRKNLSAAVVVCSDSISAGKNKDKAGKLIIEKLKENHLQLMDYSVIPDEILLIQSTLRKLLKTKPDIVIFTGGTGLSHRDRTPEALRPLLDKEIQGIAERARAYGQERTPYSMLSRSLAGMSGNTLVLALPGSTKGAGESMDALFPWVLHIFNVLEGKRH